ncbi:MAG: hypothetical protein ABSE16_01695 [Verrucomicrobiota bacterium]|jgi:hypothetical protein
MAVAYQTPGGSLTATEWNAIIAAVDALQTSYLGGLSNFLAGDATNPAPRCFFFGFDPIAPPSNLHPLAASALARFANNPNNPWNNPCPYSDTAIPSLVAGLEVDPTVVSIASVQIEAWGSGYQVGDTMAVSGGTPIGGAMAYLTVTALTNGYVAGYRLYGGSYSVAPSPLTLNPLTTLTGSGSGMKVSLTTTGAVAPISNDFQVVRLSAPTPQQWQGALAPAHPNNLYFTLTLDLCLSVVTYPVSGQNYAVTFGPSFWIDPVYQFPVGVPDLAQPWEQVELFIIGNLSFPDTRNKYNLFRIHNFGTSAATVTFGNGSNGGTITIPSGQCRCIRRTGPGGTYTAGYNYFQQMLPGDPRFFNLYSFYQTVSNGTPQYFAKDTALSNPMGIMTFLMQLLTTQVGLTTETAIDPTQFWEMSGLYCDSNPANAFFPPTALSDLIGDLLVTRGALMAVQNFSGPGGNFTGTLYSITTVTAADNWYGSGGVSVGNYCLYLGSQPGVPAIIHVDAVDSNGKVTAVSLVYGGLYSTNPGNNNGSLAGAPYTRIDFTSTSTQGTINIPSGLARFTGFENFASLIASLIPVPPGYPYGSMVTWSFNESTGTMTFVNNGMAFDLLEVGTNLIHFLTNGGPNLTINGNGSTTVTVPKKRFDRNPRLASSETATNYTYYSFSQSGSTYTLGSQQTVTVENAAIAADPADTGHPVNYTFMDTVQTLVNCLDGMNCAFVSVQNVQLLMTPFGPILAWQESYPIVAGFNSTFAYANLTYGGLVKATISGTNLVVQRAYLLASAFNNSFPGVGSQTPWHFPRSPRRYSLRRTVNHNGADEPWESYGVSGIAQALHTGAYTTLEPPNIARYFESKPIQPDLAEPEGAPVFIKAPFCKLGAEDSAIYPGTYSPLNGADPTGIALAQWLQNGLAGNWNYGAYLAAVGSGNDSPLSAALQAIVNAATPQTPCEIEHFNVAASQANGLIVGPAKLQCYVPGFPSYSPANATLPMPSGITGKFWPKTCYYSWLAPTSGTDTIAAQMTALGLTVLNASNLPDGFGTPIEVETGQYTAGVYSTATESSNYVRGMSPAFQTILSYYRWVAIDDVRNLYNRYSISFILGPEVFMPMAFVTANATIEVIETVSQPTPAQPLYGFVGAGPNFPNDDFPPPTNGSQPAGPTTNSFQINDCGFVNQSDGNWFTNPSSNVLTPAVKYPVPLMIRGAPGAWSTYTGPGIACDYRHIVEPGSPPVLQDSVGYAYPATYYQIDWMLTLDWGALDYINKQTTGATTTSLVLISENSSSTAVCLVPVNYAYQDPTFAPANMVAVFSLTGISGISLAGYIVDASSEYPPYEYQGNDYPVYGSYVMPIFDPGGLGTQIIPVIADDTQEANPPEVTVLSGVGGVGAYEHIVTTALANAVLVTLPVAG